VSRRVSRRHGASGLLAVGQYLMSVCIVMGLESFAWVLIYIAAFGVSDTAVALVAPNSPYLFLYYTIVGLVGYRLLHLTI